MKIFALCLLGVSGMLLADDIVNAKDAGFNFVLQEEVRFGGDSDDENYTWPNLNTKILPGPKGHMYIVDVDNTRILEFDKQGKFLRQATGKGNGPGELHSILCTSLAADGSVLVMDVDDSEGGAPRVLRFNPDMSFKDVTLFSGTNLIPAIMNVSPDGKRLGGLVAQLDVKNNTVKLITGILDIEKRTLVNTFSQRVTPQPDPKRLDQPGMWEDYLAGQFKILYDFGMIAFTKDGKAFVANSGTYRISRYTAGQKTPEISFTRKYKPTPFGEKERSAMVDRFYDMIPGSTRSIITKQVLARGIEKANLPPVKAPMVALIAIEDKGVLVVRDTDPVTRSNPADVFDGNGKFLCSKAFPNHGLFTFTTNNPSPRMIFRDGFAYTIETNEDDENTAVRYRYSLKK